MSDPLQILLYRSLDSQDSEDGNPNENVEDESNNVVEYESDFSDEDSGQICWTLSMGRVGKNPGFSRKIRVFLEKSADNWKVWF